VSENIMPAPTPEEEISDLKQLIAQLREQLEEARRTDDAADLRRKLETALRELEELRRTPPSPQPPPPPSKKRIDGFFEVEEP
jgi:hypothetical protein